MAKVVRVPKRVMNELRMDTHHRSYQRVMAADGLKYIWGHGSYTPDVVFVRFRPTVDEEESGHLMEGRTGNLFWKTVQQSGIGNRVWVTSMWKFCYDPHERQMMQDYQAAARVLLDWELDILKPKLVIGIMPLVHRRIQHWILTPEEGRMSVKSRREFQASIQDIGRRLNRKT